MIDFILSQLVFYPTLILVLFVPGIFLILATRMYKNFSLLELFVLSFGTSIVIIDFSVILLGRTPFGITQLSILGGIALFCASCWYIFYNYHKKNKDKTPIIEQIQPQKISRRSTFLIVIILFLTIFVKTIYFKDAIFPTVTDLGHHMYWTKVITTTGQLPVYEKSDIGADFTIGKPAPIADFIIGEHLPFAAISLISGADFISAFPVIVLFFIHIMSILAMLIVTRAIFKNSDRQDIISIVTLFLIGPLWAIGSPQAKFISGGVIGNDIGNLLIPLAILLFLRAFNTKKSDILAFALFIGLGLAYTHHLSTFVFIFFAIFTVIVYVILNLKTVIEDVKGWVKLAMSPFVLSVLAFGAIFIFLLYMPTYLNTKAIDTAVGAPSKASRAGLTLDQLKSTAGQARFAFAVIGIMLLFFARKLGKYNQAFLIGWIVALSVMSLFPGLLFVNIPSDRIASYIVFPTAIIASFMLVQILSILKAQEKTYINPLFLLFTFFILMSFIATDGLYDNALSLNTANSSKNALQTYAASDYLSHIVSPNDIVLKDHNYLSGDSWIKLFFMKGYNYPLSRGYFKRYEDETKTREQCTNFMISVPNGPDAKQCFAGTHTDFIMIDPKMDSTQFTHSKEFWQVYSAQDVGIFYKAN